MAHTPPGRTREQVWRFVRERLLAGDPPTVREVQEAFGFRAVESARAHLLALVEEGRLEQDPGRARGWRLPSQGGSGAYGAGVPVMVPILGRVQAGALTTALEEPEGMVAVMRRASAGRTRPAARSAPSPADDLFALRVRGDSMRGAGILDGDLVVVRRQETAADGEIVVALVGEEATVKRLRRGRELHAENPDFPVIVPPPGELRILGKVIEVRRHLDMSSSTTRTHAPWDA